MGNDVDIAALFFEKVRQIVAQELRGEDPSWVDQEFSALGRRTHIAAVKRRHAEAAAKGVPPRALGAQVKGRRYLLSQESLAEELGKREVAKGLAKARAKVVAADRALTTASNDTDDADYREARAALRGSR